MKLLIGADLVPTESNTDLFAQGNVEELFGEKLLQILRSADYRIFNLETPITDRKEPIEKGGPALLASPSTMVGIKKLGVDLFGISNNHILDQGANGLVDTMQVLSENGIPYVGAGENLKSAAKTYFAECCGKKIGVYACCEHEFSVATEEKAGANPFDPLESLDHIAQAKAECDYLIVLYHGGKEYYRYPSPMVQKICRKIAQKGADLVLCQHTHCIGCKEEYENSTIVYGQGNFIFDASNEKVWLTSLLVMVDNDFKVSYVPVVKKGNVIRLAEGTEAEQILSDFEKRSEEIKDPAKLKENYHKVVAAKYHEYLAVISGGESFLFKVVNKLLGENRLRKRRYQSLYGKRKKLGLRNYIQCESHRETVLYITKHIL